MFKAENFKNNTQYKYNELYRSDLDLFRYQTFTKRSGLIGLPTNVWTLLNSLHLDKVSKILENLFFFWCANCVQFYSKLTINTVVFVFRGVFRTLPKI